MRDEPRQLEPFDQRQECLLNLGVGDCRRLLTAVTAMTDTAPAEDLLMAIAAGRAQEAFRSVLDYCGPTSLLPCAEAFFKLRQIECSANQELMMGHINLRIGCGSACDLYRKRRSSVCPEEEVGKLGACQGKRAADY